MYEDIPVPAETDFGYTAYDTMFPNVGNPVSKTADTLAVPGVEKEQSPYARYVDLDLEIGGAPGLVNRNPYVIDGIPKPDAHDFRGNHAVIPRRLTGSYGDVTGEDYATQYAQGIAINAYPDVGVEQSWADISGVI